MSNEPIATWFPSEDIIKKTNLYQFMQNLGFSDYTKLHKWSYQQQEQFIDKIINQLSIKFDKPFSTILDVTSGLENPKWFKDSQLNITNSCFNANSETIAIIEQNETGKKRSITYGELDALSNQIASALLTRFKPKDRFGIISPMTIEAVALHLGILKAGCTTIAVAESFSLHEIETRFAIAQPQAVFIQDSMIRNQKKVTLYSNLNTIALPMIVIKTEENITLRTQDELFTSFLARGEIQFQTISCLPTDYTIILFSSGTTATPKAIPWSHVTPIKCASDAFFHHDLKPGERFLWPSSLGWMMGAWLIYATLLNKATMALFDGSPNLPLLGEFIEKEKITHVGVVPTLVKSWRTTQCMERYDWSHIRLFTSTGECSNSEDMQYLMGLAQNKPIIEYCGGTEIGGAYITGTLLTPNAPACFTTPAMGLNFKIIDQNGLFSQEGEVAIFAPALGLSTELLNSDHHIVYYENMPKINEPDFILRRHGDLAEQFKNGFYQLLGRADDTLNLSGIKVSCVEIERVLIDIDNIKEVAVVGVTPPGGGPSLLIIFVTLIDTTTPTDKIELKTKMQAIIKKDLNALFKIYDVEIVPSLPRTASNKILRRFLKKEYEKKLNNTGSV